MATESANRNQSSVSPFFGHVVSIIFNPGRYVYLPLAVVSAIGWAFDVTPWYVFPVFAFGYVYIEYLRRRFLREIPFYWSTNLL